MNRPWPAAITVLTKYLPAPLEEAWLQQDDRLSLLLHDFWDKGSRHFNFFWSSHRVVDVVQTEVRAVVFGLKQMWQVISAQ